MLKRSMLVAIASLTMGFGAATVAAQPCTPPNCLDVNMDAALEGEFGLEVVMGGTNATFLADATPEQEGVYRLDFLIAHNDITMDNNTFHHVLMTRQAGVGNILRLTMQRLNDQYKLVCRVKRDTGGTYFCGKFNIASGTTRVGVEWVAASGPGTNDGQVTLSKGINIKFERLDLDNSTQAIDTVRFGLPRANSTMATTMGSFYLDSFGSFRTLEP